MFPQNQNAFSSVKRYFRLEISSKNMITRGKYLHKASIGEKMFFWYSDHLAVFEALIS